jgi:SAM-dependent methyltransferase
MLRIAKIKMVRKWGTSGAALVRGRAETLPLPDTCLDSVVATFPSEYIFRIETLQSCRRVLVPGGRLVILLGVQVGGRSIINAFLRWLYAVTGQSTPEKPALECGLDRLRECGFEGRMVKLNFQQDTLTAFVAENSLL